MQGLVRYLYPRDYYSATTIPRFSQQYSFLLTSDLSLSSPSHNHEGLSFFERSPRTKHPAIIHGQKPKIRSSNFQSLYPLTPNIKVLNDNLHIWVSLPRKVLGVNCRSRSGEGSRRGFNAIKRRQPLVLLYSQVVSRKYTNIAGQYIAGRRGSDHTYRLDASSKYGTQVAPGATVTHTKQRCAVLD